MQSQQRDAPPAGRPEKDRVATQRDPPRPTGAPPTSRRAVRPTGRVQSKFDLSTRRAPRSRSFSLFSAADPRSPADMPARPPSPRAPSPGGRPPRTCTRWTAGGRRAAWQHSVILRGQPAPPQPAEGTREHAPHDRPRRARSRPAGDPCGPAPQQHQQLANSPRASYGKTDRRGAPV